MTELPFALAAMGAFRQFIVYRSAPSTTRIGKIDKFPSNHLTGFKCDVTDPAYYTDHVTAIAAAERLGESYGVGFVFTEADPFWFFDIDACLVDGAWSQLAQYFCQMFAGAAVERSMSGTGLHIFGMGTSPAHGCKNTLNNLEFYTSGRFVALTGDGVIGNCAVDFTHVLPTFVAQWFPETVTVNAGELVDWSDEPCAEWRGPSDDDELIRRALRSSSAGAAFGNRASFADLWNCNVSVLALAYPDPMRPYDSSAADAALAQHLAFWTGRNCERIRKIMLESQLVRDKWERDDYLPRTIVGAVSRQMDVLTDKEMELPYNSKPVAVEAPQQYEVEGATFLRTDMQQKLFKGCVYIRDLHRAYSPNIGILKPEQFKVAFGGYTFTLDSANEKTSRDAWEAFTQSQILRAPKVDSACFKPDLQSGVIIHRGGQSFVNTYEPVDIPRKVGDCRPFLAHLAKLLPDERDRIIMLSYMAACVQHKGVKFQWAPLLQGVEGNGKTMLTRCVAEAIGRRYVFWPKASKLTKQFNAWMVGKLFYAVEDIHVPDDRIDIIEELKPMITGGDGLEIEGKGVDQISADICGNFILNSNHKGAIKKTQNDRRYCMLFTAQQKAEHLARDGMGGSYFSNLYDWLNADGYAIVAELLHTYQIPDEFNPATKCQRAPKTTSTDEAIDASMGSIEQSIYEAVGEDRPGFIGGWISSMQLDRLLSETGKGRFMSYRKRHEMLDAMGYEYHPALSSGRVNKLVLPDNGKPRLYIHRESLSILGGLDAKGAAEAYERSNNKAVAHGFGR